MLTVFVPTTPNPTSGFFMIVPDWAAREVNLSVNEAFRLIVTGGIIAGGNSDIMQRIEKSILPIVLKRKEEY